MAAPACTRRSSAGRSPRRFSTATLIAVSGVLQVMAQRREQRRRKIGLLPDELGRVTLRQELGPFDRDGDDARNGVECADIECRRGRREEPDRLRAVPQRNNRHLVLLADAGVAAVRALVGVELQRASGLRQGRVQHVGVDGDFLGSALVDLPAVVGRKADRHPGQLKATCDVSGQHLDGACGFGGQQHVPRQIEQTRHLVATRDRLARPILCRRRQIAGDDRDDQEGEQRDPVLRIGDREGANRRQKEEVQREHRHDRHEDRDPQARDASPCRARPAAAPVRRWWGSRRGSMRSRAGHDGDRSETAEQDDDIACGTCDEAWSTQSSFWHLTRCCAVARRRSRPRVRGDRTRKS